MLDQIAADLIKLTLQLILIGGVGGAVSWFYSRIQKQRELRISLLREFAALQGRFVSLRFRFNTFHQSYQQWRRQIGANQPVLQSKEGKSDQTYKDLRTNYGNIIQKMRNQI